MQDAIVGAEFSNPCLGPFNAVLTMGAAGKFVRGEVNTDGYSVWQSSSDVS